jgi:predicted N-acyltransferase
VAPALLVARIDMPNNRSMHCPPALAREQFELRLIVDLSTIEASAWNALTGDQPFLKHEFFQALHLSGSACSATGWSPQFLTAWAGTRLVGALPLYLKTHSYGEYVFDWAWAEAYETHGLEYYPKLLSAVPFTPVSGPRLLAASAPVRRALLDAVLNLSGEYSSLHMLFPDAGQAEEMREAGLLIRHGVQFHWHNHGYASFNDFLATLTHAKRKRIRQERRRVRESGISFECKTGAQISATDWRFFQRCYAHTYRAHRSSPYLNLDFFERVGASLGEHTLMVIASRAGQPLAAALNFYTRHALYGRYWGALEYVPGLHFETCYYQAQQFCIAHGIALMEGGAQGEHKLARGFTPVETLSAHWLRHPQFADAVARYLAREAQGVEHYIDELNEHTPFKQRQHEPPAE